MSATAPAPPAATATSTPATSTAPALTTPLDIKTVASTLPDKTQSAKGTAQAAATGMPEAKPAFATHSGVELGEVDLADIDEDDPPADSASEPPDPIVGSGASAPASTASCGNLFAFGAASTAPAASGAPAARAAAPVAALPDAAAFHATAAPPATGGFSFGSGAGTGPPAASPFRGSQGPPAAAGISFSFGLPALATAPAAGAAAPAVPAFSVDPAIGDSNATTAPAAAPSPARSPASGVCGLSAAPAAAFFGGAQAPVPAFGAAPAGPATICCATPFGAAPAAQTPAFGALAPAPAFSLARSPAPIFGAALAPAFGAALAPTFNLGGSTAALLGGGGGASATAPSAFGGAGDAATPTGGFGGFGAAAVPAAGGFGGSAGATATPACGAPAAAGAVPTSSLGAPAASITAVAGGLGASVGMSNPIGAVVAKTGAEFGGSTANATASLRSQQAEPLIPASTPAATEVRVQGALSRVEADGLCCLAWHAAAKEVPLNINLEGVQASPETLAVACWALCPSVTSLSLKQTRLTAEGANTVALERLCGLLRVGHAATGSLTEVR